MFKKASLTNLTKLTCNYNITDYDIVKLSNLEILITSSTKLTDKSISQLTNLNCLNCLNSPLSSLSINKLHKLKILGFYTFEPIMKISQEILTQLIFIKYISSNNFDINYTLPNIEHIWATSKITERSYQYLSNIKLLNSKNYLIPDKLFHLTNLESLSTGGRGYTDDHLIKLPNLTNLNCVNNRFSESVLNSLTKLTTLYLVNTNPVIQYSLSGLVNLTSLNCMNSMINDKELQKLTKLTHLDLFNNKLPTDESIKQLTNLTSLGCGNNINITDVSLFNLPKLQRLHCGKNINFTINGILHSKHLNYLEYTSTSITPGDVIAFNKYNKFYKLITAIKLKKMIND
jgi:hypothetical protein